MDFAAKVAYSAEGIVSKRVLQKDIAWVWRLEIFRVQDGRQ